MCDSCLGLNPITTARQKIIFFEQKSFSPPLVIQVLNGNLGADNSAVLFPWKVYCLVWVKGMCCCKVVPVFRLSWLQKETDSQYFNCWVFLFLTDKCVCKQQALGNSKVFCNVKYAYGKRHIKQSMLAVHSLRVVNVCLLVCLQQWRWECSVLMIRALMQKWMLRFSRCCGITHASGSLVEIELFIPSLGPHEAAPALYFSQVSKHAHRFMVCHDTQAHMESAHFPTHSLCWLWG